jgi:hypothetical protein
VFYILFLTCFAQLIHTVKYEARLEDGTVVSKSDGVEFAVKDGLYLETWTLHNVGFSSELLVLNLQNLCCQVTSALRLPRL